MLRAGGTARRNCESLVVMTNRAGVRSGPPWPSFAASIWMVPGSVLLWTMTWASPLNKERRGSLSFSWQFGSPFPTPISTPFPETVNPKRAYCMFLPLIVLLPDLHGISRSLKNVCIDRTEHHGLLKRTVAEDTFSRTGNGDLLLFPCRVDDEQPAIDNPGKYSFGSLRPGLNPGSRVEIVHHRLDHGRIGFGSQIDRITFAESVDGDCRRMVCGVGEPGDNWGGGRLQHFIVVDRCFSRLIP